MSRCAVHPRKENKSLEKDYDLEIDKIQRDNTANLVECAMWVGVPFPLWHSYVI